MTKADSNRIVGLVRFSYPSIGGFAHASPDPARFLYDPARLDRRFRLFEALCLPALRAQTDPDFDIVFLVGKDMPSAARKRLDAALSPLRRAQVVALPPCSTIRRFGKPMAPSRSEVPRLLTTFRLDDDDALACDYIARLRALSVGLTGLCPPEDASHPVVPPGFPAAPRWRVVRGGRKASPASGSAMIAPSGHRDNIYRRNHRLLPQLFSHFSDAGRPAFLRSIHEGQTTARPKCRAG